MSDEPGLVERLRAEVLGGISEHRHRLERSGGLVLSVSDEQALGRQLIAEALDADARAALSSARPVRSASEEDALAQEVFDSLFRLGRLQRLLDDPSIENINANGPDCVWVRYADGRREGPIRSPAPTRSWSS